MRVAIVGCGVIAPTHAKALALDGRCELVLACDPDLGKARALGATRVASDWREALGAGIDLVILCTPHHEHAAQAVAVLQAGKHLLCEKPLATTPDAVRHMVDAAQAAGTVASGIFQHRFSPLARRVHELVRGGDFGPLLSAAMDFRCTRTAAYYASGPWRGRWAGEGGAVLINQAIHTLDLVNWFCGTPVSVAGTVSQQHPGMIECEDHGQGVITYAADGADAGAGADTDADAAATPPQASIVCSNDQVTDWYQRITVTCRDGAIELGDHHRLLTVTHSNQALCAELRTLDQIRLDGVRLPGKDCYGDHHALQIQDVLSAIRAGRAPFVTLADAAVTNQVVLGLYCSSAQHGAPVALPARSFTRPDLLAQPKRQSQAGVVAGT